MNLINKKNYRLKKNLKDSRFFIKQKSAFTLIELIVSLSIITLLTTIFIANYHSVNKRTDLTFSSQILVSEIRQAQSNALGLVQYGDEIPKGGWGVYFDINSNNQYKIFADLNGNFKYDEGEAIPELGGLNISLPDKIKISSLRVKSEGSVDRAHIVFLPPDPKTIISGEKILYDIDSEAEDWFELSITEETEGFSRLIRVNFLGLIEVDE